MFLQFKYMHNITFECKRWNEIPREVKISMLKLRYNVFVKELKWTAGLIINDEMETDQYDNNNAIYIFSKTEEGEVNACCRLISTNFPYMIHEIYPQSVSKIELPKCSTIWEISRFCTSQEIRGKTKLKIMAMMIGSVIEFGLKNGIINYISLSTDSILPVIRRYADWDPTPIGKLIDTPDDKSFAIILTVSEVMLQQACKKAGVDMTHKFL